MRIDIAKERERLTDLEGHTPGPWDNSGPGELVGTMIDGRYEWSCIADIGEVDRHHKSEKAANARLIAAAPELHSTLTAALNEIARLTAEVERLTKGSICEVAATNLSVMEYMRHWEGRAEKAEAGRDQALARLAVAQRETMLRCLAIVQEIDTRVDSDPRMDGSESRVLGEAELGIISLTLDTDSEAALQRVVAEARLEGWRAGRDAAAKIVDGAAKYLTQGFASMRDTAVKIRALPEPKDAPQ